MTPPPISTNVNIENSKYRVRISHNNMLAFLSLKNAVGLKGVPSSVAQKDITNFLKINNISYGHQLSAIKSFCKRAYSHAVRDECLCASGKNPTAGEKPYLDFGNYQNKFTSSAYLNVNEGGLICRVSFEILGRSGFDVFGNTVTATNDWMLKQIQGGNTFIGPDSNLYSAINGCLFMDKNNFVHVEPEISINQSIGEHTGDLEIYASIRILGNVSGNIKVRSLGNVAVTGNVYESSITAKGDILISGNLVGNQCSIVISEGLVSFKNATKTRIKSFQGVVCDSMTDCQVMTDGNIAALPGGLFGGIYKAKGSIKAGDVGAANQNTSLSVGAETDATDKNSFTCKSIDELHEQQAGYRQCLADIENEMREKVSNFDVALLSPNDEMFEYLNNFNCQKKELVKKIRAIDLQLSDEHRNNDSDLSSFISSSISIKKRVLAGTKIQVDCVEFVLENDTSTVAFFKGNGIETVSLNEYDN